MTVEVILEQLDDMIDKALRLPLSMGSNSKKIITTAQGTASLLSVVILDLRNLQRCAAR